MKKIYSSKQLLSHTYSNGYRLDVTTKGFTLWNTQHNAWILDASCLREDNEVMIGADAVLNSGGFDNKIFTLRQIKKRDKAKDSPVTVRSKRPVQHSHSVMVKSK